MSRPRWWRCKLQLIRPRRPGHCLGPAWWAPSVQEGGGRQGVAAAAAAATATATAAAAAAAAAVVLMVGSGSSCSSGSLSGSGCSLSRGASSSSSSSSSRRRAACPLLLHFFANREAAACCFRHGTCARSAPLRAIMHGSLSPQQVLSCERVRHKRMHACCVVGRVRAGSVRMLHPLLVACSLARLFVGSRPPGRGRAQVIVRSPSTHPGLS